MMKKSLFVVFALVVMQGCASVAMTVTSLGEVTSVFTVEEDARDRSVIYTASGRGFVAYTQHTRVAELDVPLVLITKGRNQYLCNVNGGACAKVVKQEPTN